jgi:topoisomerase IA-like protein
MRIDFDDGGYVEISRATTPGKLYIIVAARNADRTKTVNSAEVSDDELDQLLADVKLQKQSTKPPTKKKTTKAKKKPQEEEHERNANTEEHQQARTDQQHAEGGVQAPER